MNALPWPALHLLSLARSLLSGSLFPIAFAALSALVTPAHADTRDWLQRGRPAVVTEIEREKSADGNEIGNGLTLYPGLRWDSGLINQLELRIAYEREREREDEGPIRSLGRDYAVRVRSNFPVQGALNGFVRVLAGYKREREQRYPFGYVEGALTYPVHRVELYSGYRFVRALDSTPGRDFDQLRMGAGYELNAAQELEFRVARGWDRASRARRSDAMEVEFTQKF